MTLVREPSIEARHMERASLVLHEIRGIPAPSPATLRLIDFALSNQHSVAELVGLIRENRTLAAPLLAEASGGDWQACPAATVTAYVEQLGVPRVLETSLAILTMQGLGESLPPMLGGLDRCEFWRHSLAVACTARTIAYEINQPLLAMAAFVGGLYHDVGKLALDGRYPKSYRRVLHLTETAKRCVCDAEQDAFGLDHTFVGKRLVAAWQLPSAVQDCAWLHHHPAHTLPHGLEHARLVHILNLADNLVRRQQLGFSGYNHVDLEAARHDILGVANGTLERIESGISAELEAFTVMTRLDDRAASDLCPAPRPQVSAGGRTRPRLAAPRISRASAATARLARTLRGDEDVAAVCRGIAESMCAVFDLPAAVVFAVPREGRHCTVGVCADGVMSNDVVTIAGQEQNGKTAPDDFPIPSDGWVSDRPERFASIEDRFERILLASASGEVVRAFHLVHYDRVVGGVLFSAPAGQNGLDEASPEELETLSLTFGWALSSAGSRGDMERAAESILASQRKRHVAEPEEVHEASLAMLAQMAAGAAHELNNPLAVIAGRAQMLRQDIDDAHVARHLDIIDEHARRASDIVSELMRFAKPDPPHPEAISVRSWALRLQQYWYLRSSLGADQFVVSISDEAAEMYVDVAQLDEAAAAIIANAIEAMTPENARLQINSNSAESDDTIVVSIGDNGRGMSPDVLKHACDPFFSHRPAGRGRGLGLSRAARLLENNGGHLKIESRPGAGATVLLTVPSAPRQPSPRSARMVR